MDLRNLLQETIVAQNLIRGFVAFQHFRDGRGEILNFPQLTEEEISTLTNGPYQLYMARAYAKTHLGVNGRFPIDLHRHPRGPGDFLLRARIPKRFIIKKIKR